MTEERDPQVSGRYRALGEEEPPRALDEAVLAAARRAVETHPAPLVAPTGRRAWFVPLAAAAVLLLAVGVVLHMQLEQPDLDGARLEARAPRPERQEQRAAPAVPAAPVQAPAAQSPAVEPKSAVASKPMAATAPVAAAPPAAVPQAEPAAVPAMAAGRAREEAELRSAASAARVARSADAPAPTPEKELERIAALREAGRHEEADKALAEFRKRHPDYRIPEAMLERVERR